MVFLVGAKGLQKIAVRPSTMMTRFNHHVAERVERVLVCKAASGKTYDEIADVMGVTNTYAAQLLLGQAKLTPDAAAKLKVALPELNDKDLVCMQETFPMRSFDDDILKEPNVYRTYEAITHYGTAIKSIINEQCE